MIKIRNLKRAKNGTISVEIERAPLDIATCRLCTPYRLQFFNKTKAIIRFVRTGYNWGGEL